MLTEDNHSDEALDKDITHGLSVIDGQGGTANPMDDAGNTLYTSDILDAFGRVPWANTFNFRPPAEGNDIAETTITTRDDDDGDKDANAGNDRQFHEDE